MRLLLVGFALMGYFPIVSKEPETAGRGLGFAACNSANGGLWGLMKLC